MAGRETLSDGVLVRRVFALYAADTQREANKRRRAMATRKLMRKRLGFGKKRLDTILSRKNPRLSASERRKFSRKLQRSRGKYVMKTVLKGWSGRDEGRVRHRKYAGSRYYDVDASQEQVDMLEAETLEKVAKNSRNDPNYLVEVQTYDYEAIRVSPVGGSRVLQSRKDRFTLRAKRSRKQGR